MAVSQRFGCPFLFRSGFSSSSSYRAAGKADRLLRAAVVSFCANARPTRREAAQFDDLSGPLLASASEETLRFMAATLSDSPYAPPALMRRLADLPVEISAPLLMRSPVLTPIDLLALIARHGLGHARAIARRTDLDQRIRLIIRTLETASKNTSPATNQKSLEETRDRLRAMMHPAQENTAPVQKTAQDRQFASQDPDDAGIYHKLRSAALSAVPTPFHIVLAEALAIDPGQARNIVEDEDTARLILALRALPLDEAEAFLVMQCLRPSTDRRGITAFLNVWQAVAQEEARRAVEDWRSPPDNLAMQRENLKAS